MQHGPHTPPSNSFSKADLFCNNSSLENSPSSINTSPEDLSFLSPGDLSFFDLSVKILKK